MSDATADKPSYKDTLNLPQTGFAMRANLAQNEPQSQKRWEKNHLYAQVQAAHAGQPRFLFHDGPPYANGDIHVGHLLNKVLKDFVVRTRTMAGFDCPYVPGWDCHGLPIEHRVMTQLVESGKAEKLNTLSEDNRRMAIRRECQKYAEKYVKLQTGQMKRLSTLADYDDPYLTMAPAYEQAVLEVFATLVERGLVYRALKAVHWSIANETALAEAELEYEDREDPSIYVDFEAVDRDAVARAFGLDELDETPSFMIWTTTPWTLPANLAIAVRERFEYGLVRMDGGLTIMARERIETVATVVGAQDVEVLATTSGSALLGLQYKHAFCPRTSTIVAAEYVTLEDGTGLVHTAPGHGNDDYQTGLREGLDIYCPVLGNGTYDQSVPDWLQGMLIWDANPLIIKRLRESGHLVHAHQFTHSYPHDWRSKTPVIFRATEQWFVSVESSFDVGGETASSSLRDRALRAVESDITFIPAWGRNRMRGMLDSRPDWCLSRQRSWGLPIPAFMNNEGEVLLTPASVRAVASVIAEKGSDAWFTDSPQTLLASYDAANDPDAPAWARVKDVSLTKMYDIFDVWFESGSSWNAVLLQRDLGYPADLYLEGSDQHRGWFQLSLLPALGVTGVSPFKALLTHGFMVDKDGRKMSKSGGNALNVEDLLKDFGADVCRWWVSSLAFENDIKVDASFFTTAGESYRKVRNTIRFLLSNLFDFHAADSAAALAHASPLDQWAFEQLRALDREVRSAFERYEFRKAHLALYDFCNETMSAVYLAAVKDRLYCDACDSRRRRATQAVLATVADALIRLLAPLMPHTADEAFTALKQGSATADDDTSVHALRFATLPQSAGDHSTTDWDRVLEMRDEVLRLLETAKAGGLENPLDAGVRIADKDGAFSNLAVDLADLLGVSRVQCDRELSQSQVEDLRDQPRCERCWKRADGMSAADQLCQRCHAAVQGARGTK
ncbi:MAG: isoleucine--tRNA ligase [Phycisphaerales bacterium]